jgi:hypothetical protein
MTAMDEQRRGTAYHEAGHAVSSYAKGIPMDGASISEKDHSLGRVIFGREPEYWRYREGAEEIMFALIVVSRAGVKAAEMGTGSPTDADDPNIDPNILGSDWRGTLQYLDELCGEDESRREVIWEQAGREAERVLRENWPAVEAVAERLLEHKTLDALQLEAILESANCEHDESVVTRAFLDDEHERLVSRKFELWGRHDKLIDEGASASEIEAVLEELQHVERRIEVIGAFLWPEEEKNA